MLPAQAYRANIPKLARPILGTVFAALFVALSLHFSRRKYRQDRTLPREGKLPKTKRLISLRIRGISDSTSIADIENQLKEFADVDDVLVHPLVRMRIDPGRRCTVADIDTSVPEAELLHKLNSVPKQSHTYDCNFFGITTLSEHEDTKVDVIAVPGLASHAIGSWKSGKECWLRDYLPDDISQIRVLIYGYDTKLLHSGSKNSIQDLGRQFLAAVTAEEVPRRPIVLIGHSLGGLLIKEALVYSHECSFNPKGSRYILHKACCGLLFFGVPNLGLRNESLPSLVQGQPNQKMVEDLVVDKDSEPSPFIKRMTEHFARCFEGKYRVVSFFERQPSPTVEIVDGKLRKTGPEKFLVTEESATSVGITSLRGEENEPLDTDHSGLVKFETRWGTYASVKQFLIEMVSEAAFQDELLSEKKRQWDNLNDPPYNFFRNSTELSKPAPGTLQWLVQDDNIASHSNDESVLQSSHFLAWKNSAESDSLLVTAGPGKGKSVLTNFVLEHLESASVHDAKIIYYFCNIKNDVYSRNAKSILRALVVQMCENDRILFDKIPSKFVEKSQQFFSASHETLLEVFKNLLQQSAYKKVFCVIDGLDVYSDGRKDMIEGLREICDGQIDKPAFKLFCTSRPSQEISKTWKIQTEKALRCNPEDITSFIRFQRKRLSVQTADLINEGRINQLRKLAQNTFLWITLVFRELDEISYPSQAKVRKVIKKRGGLDRVYADLVEGATRKSKDNARLLLLVVFAKRPLRCCEISDAISIDPTDTDASYSAGSPDRMQVTPEEVRQRLGTLLDVVGDTVYLIHQSVKDFVEQKQPFRDFDGLNPRLFPALVSMKYLDLYGSNPTPEMCTEMPFTRYAARYWDSHIDSMRDIQDNLHLRDLFKKLFMPQSGRLGSWTAIVCLERRLEYTACSTIGQVVLALDIRWLAEGMLDKEMGLPCVFEEDCVARAAERTGSVLEVLLTHKAAKNYPVSAEAVISIARKHEADMMQLLLEERGSEVNITNKLVLPAVQSDEGAGMLRLILEKCGEKVVITERVLIAAVTNWAGEWMLRLLLEKCGDKFEITPKVVIAAVESVGGRGITQLLVEDDSVKIAVTPQLLIAAIEGESDKKEEILRLLLEDNKDEDSEEEDSEEEDSEEEDSEEEDGEEEYGKDEVAVTPKVLIAAMRSENEQREGILRLLLEEYGGGVEINEDVVIAAIKAGEGVLQLLLEVRKDKAASIQDMVASARGLVRTR